MDAGAVIDTYGNIDGLAWTLLQHRVGSDQARFWARRCSVSLERDLLQEELAPEIAAKIAKNMGDAVFERYLLFSKAGGAPWDFYPVREHGQRLAKVLQGVPEIDIDGAMAPYLDPIKADLMRRGFSPEDAEEWCEHIADESGMWMDGGPPAEWLALCGYDGPLPSEKALPSDAP